MLRTSEEYSSYFLETKLYSLIFVNPISLLQPIYALCKPQIRGRVNPQCFVRPPFIRRSRVQKLPPSGPKQLITRDQGFSISRGLCTLRLRPSAVHFVSLILSTKGIVVYFIHTISTNKISVQLD